MDGGHRLSGAWDFILRGFFVVTAGSVVALIGLLGAIWDGDTTGVGRLRVLQAFGLAAIALACATGLLYSGVEGFRDLPARGPVARRLHRTLAAAFAAGGLWALLTCWWVLTFRLPDAIALDVYRETAVDIRPPVSLGAGRMANTAEDRFRERRDETNGPDIPEGASAPSRRGTSGDH